MPTPLQRFYAGAAACGVVLSCTFATTVAAQEFPTRPLRLVLGFAPGGGSDLIGRMIAGQLTEQIGKQVIVENRPGAGGTVAAEAVSKAAPDGYTLFLATIANALHPHVYKLNYDPIKGFAPVSLLARGGYVLAINPGLPATTVKEFIAYAKANPGKVHMGNSGAGSFVHLTSVLFSMMAGADIVHVSYKGSGPAIIEVLGGHAQGVISAPGQLAGHIKSGKLRGIGVTDAKRVPSLPDIPTIAEAGVPGYEAANWWAIVATGGTPKPIVDKLHKEISAVLDSPKAKEQFAKEGAEVAPLAPDALGKFMAAEIEKWGKVVRAAKIKVE
jgi:tripartite-type tricarboxylate transporter receptor subunit TctC